MYFFLLFLKDSKFILFELALVKSSSCFAFCIISLYFSFCGLVCLISQFTYYQIYVKLLRNLCSRQLLYSYYYWKKWKKKKKMKSSWYLMNLSSDQLKFDVNAEDFNSLCTRKFPIYFKYTNCELNNDWNVWLVRFWKKVYFTHWMNAN